MVYRIHFTSEDLARTRVAPAPMPLSELNLAARLLQVRTRDPRLAAWRRRAAVPLPASARMALSLFPPLAPSPTFAAPARAGTLEELLDLVRATPRKEVEAQLAAVAEHHPVPAWARHLGDDMALREAFCEGLGHLHTHLLSPYWTRIADLFALDRTVRMQHFMHGGVERLLVRANPRWLRWRPPVLEVRMVHEVDLDLYLRGQGVMLVPSAFGSRSAVDPDQPQPAVTYPAGHDLPLVRLTALTEPGTASTLTALLGNTRARVLTAVAEHPGCTTKELAVFCGISASSASEHATVLRAAGLIQTARQLNTALHSPTGLGADLLAGGDRHSAGG
ncbi:winged helix-turn-helix domain-containing protein [Streptomyces sp. HPF1205]|uniref:winged helix-turn-helix domain-containing protein n=1 Tax=Streptomyces sp. HPF1205 TaxID=2873262 RepID=UPI001CEC2637|nr:winged helix-turn-helix domain-containing protein [Streptomyces sp. HPF1205]